MPWRGFDAGPGKFRCGDRGVIPGPAGPPIPADGTHPIPAVTDPGTRRLSIPFITPPDFVPVAPGVPRLQLTPTVFRPW